MRATAADVRDRVGESTGAVGEAGSHLLDRLQRSAELDHVTRSLQSTRQVSISGLVLITNNLLFFVMETGSHLLDRLQRTAGLQMCRAVGEYLAGQRHYNALKLWQSMGVGVAD